MWDMFIVAPVDSGRVTIQEGWTNQETPRKFQRPPGFGKCSTNFLGSEVLRTHEMRHMEECEQRTGRIMMNLRTLSFDGMILGYFGSFMMFGGFGSFMMCGEMARHPSVKARHLDSFFGCKISPYLSITASKSMTWWAVSTSCWWQTAGEIVGSCDSCLILLVLDFCAPDGLKSPFEVGTCPFLVAPKWRMTTSENR